MPWSGKSPRGIFLQTSQTLTKKMFRLKCYVDRYQSINQVRTDDVQRTIVRSRALDWIAWTKSIDARILF